MKQESLAGDKQAKMDVMNGHQEICLCRGITSIHGGN